MNKIETYAALGMALTLLGPSAAKGQDGAAPEAARADGLQLERVVVTGTAGSTSKMKASVSISTLEGSDIDELVPASAADLLRAVPGLRAEASGGEGNANITVRGVPISAGGARYVQIQEDGLPVLQAGDFNFITSDSYIRIDGSVEHLEVVRGGSASTMASNSPAGIVNFISKTGREPGGGVGISSALGYAGTRIDGDYGGRLDGRTRFFVGGFYRQGENVRKAGADAEVGGQIRANITRQFDDGFIRLSLKHLHDRAPTALPVPVQVTDGTISALPGIDPRTATFYSPYWGQDHTLERDNGKRATDVNDGLAVRSSSVGFEAAYTFGDGWNLSQNWRKSRNAGRFTGVFPADNGREGSFIFATGPSAGQPYVGRALAAVVFNTAIDDAGNTVNDTRLAKTFALRTGASVKVMGGWYHSLQKLGLTWNFNEYLLQASGSAPALLQTASATPGLVGPAFGGCCSRVVDLEYRLASPYLNVGYEQGPLNIDASVRADRQRASGTANIARGASVYLPATEQKVHYRIGHNAYSAGANYRLTRSLALFGRVSEGVAFNADRILFGTPLDGSAPININIVRQREAGIKWRNNSLSGFATAFHATTAETNFEATTQTRTANRYRASGVELEVAYRADALSVRAGATLTDARITDTAPGTEGVIGNTPRRQSKIVYQGACGYGIGKTRYGISIVGTGKSWGDDANTIVLPAYRVLHGFLTYQVNARVGVALSANNLFNATAYTEVEGDGHAARALSGRAVKASVRYAF